MAQNIRVNPDWEYRFYDDSAVENLLEVQLGTMFIDRFRRIDPSYGAAKADLFRYACILMFGGAYLDIKSVCTRPLSSSIRSSDRCILSHWSSTKYPRWGEHSELTKIGGELQQWFLIASPGDPLIAAALESAVENVMRYRYLRDGFGQFCVLRTTGPIAFTKAVATRLTPDNHRMVDSWEDLGLEYDAFGSLRSREHATGPTYRDALRPLLVPRFLPRSVWPAYFYSSDTLAAAFRSFRRSLKRPA